MSVSCLVRNFSRYADLAPRDIAFLLRFEERPVHYKVGDDVFGQGVEVDHVYVLSSGWCFVKYEQPDGSRQILDVCHGGDIIGMREVCFHRSLCGMQVLADSVLCQFPKGLLTQMFSEHPRLAAILFLAGMRREALLIERAVNLGRRSAYVRLRHFVSEIKDRVDHVGDVDTAHFDVPIPAALLADILGLSEVHTYRMLKQMAGDNLRPSRTVFSRSPIWSSCARRQAIATITCCWTRAGCRRRSRTCEWRMPRGIRLLGS